MPLDLTPSLRDARLALDALLADDSALVAINAIAADLAQTLREGHKLLICGNGGSACDAAHFAEELTGRFRNDRPALAAIACNDASHITCTANDFGFDHVFSRWVEALARPGDALIVLSTSGNSPNILKALDAARDRNVATIALLGKDGGAARARASRSLVVPGQTSDRIQELHMLVLHAWVEAIENTLFPRHLPTPTQGRTPARH
jgi:D-sedoheptulose 7-phosphate isomerase